MKYYGMILSAAILLASADLAMALEGKPQKAALPNLPGDVRSAVFSPDGKVVAVSAGQFIRVWEWQTGRDLATISGGVAPVFSEDGQALAFPGQDEYNNDGLMVWDIAANKKRAFIAGDNVISPAFTPGKNWIAAAVGSRIKIWDMATGKDAVAMPSAHKCSITSVSYLQGGKRLISADARGNCLLWDLSVDTEPKKIAEFKRDTDDTPINAVASTPSGTRIALSTGGGEILILDATTLKLAGVMKGHSQKLTVKSVAFSADNQLLASACSGIEDVEIKLWDAANLKQLYAFIGHAGGVNCVSFSRDGKWLVTGSDDKSARVWDVAALMVLATPPPPPLPKKEGE